MKITRMQECHLDDIARLEEECFSHPWSRQSLAEELENPAAVFLTAIEDDGETVLGYAGMHVVCGEGYIDNIAVFSHARRKGVGRALVEALIHWQETHDGLFLTLEVRPSNEGAVALYRSAGFEEVGRRRNFYQDPLEDALLMTRTLSH